jgi:hypothetical protein
MALSQRFYPISYEWPRLLRVALAAVGAFLLSALLVPAPLPALAGLLLRGVAVLVSYPLLLMALGFHDARELAALATLFQRGRRPRPPMPVDEGAELAGEVVSTPMPDETDDLTNAARRQSLD